MVIDIFGLNDQPTLSREWVDRKRDLRGVASYLLTQIPTIEIRFIEPPDNEPVLAAFDKYETARETLRNPELFASFIVRHTAELRTHPDYLVDRIPHSISKRTKKELLRMPREKIDVRKAK